MPRYNIHYLSPKNIWFYAIEAGFINLAKNNPGWTFSMTNMDGGSDVIPELYILDLTATTDINIDELPLTNGRMLILVHGWQRRLIRHLCNNVRCSVLCVDELSINFREIVECSVRNKRFKSPLIRVMCIQPAQVLESTSLTAAETRILDLICEGKNGVEMSEILFRSQKTVSSHKRNIMRKFGVTDDLGLKQKLQALAEAA